MKKKMEKGRKIDRKKGKKWREMEKIHKKMKKGQRIEKKKRQTLTEKTGK